MNAPYSRGARRHNQRYCTAEEDKLVPAVPINQVVVNLLKKLGLENHLWFADLLQAWPQVVGDTVARHARPGRFDGATLCVFVDNSIWLNELRRYGESQLLTNLQRRFDRIKAIRWMLDPEQTRPPIPGPGP